MSSREEPCDFGRPVRLVAGHMIGLPIAVVYTNALEWFVHKHVLHGMGKRRENFWSFHWHDHHQASRKANMYDAQYVRPLFTWSPQGKELLALVLTAAVHLLLFPVAPFFAGYIVVHAIRYYFLHKRAHLDAEWCRENVPWHYDHHMGKDQNANWCVTHPWFDYVMGTRKKYTYDATGKPIAEEPVPKPKNFWARLVLPLFQGKRDRARVVRTTGAQS